MVNDDIGYIKLNKFSAKTYEEFYDAVADLQGQGMSKLILDLRSNAGGYLGAAIGISDEFLDDGKLIVYTEGKNRPRNYAFATKNGKLLDSEIVILIDEGSASASEIVAGALQDNDKGLIIGRRSFGKGLVQEQLDLPDGSALRLTVARYYTPTGRSIQKPYTKENFDDYYHESMSRYTNGEMHHGGGGIMPDIFVPLITDTIHTYYNILANKGLIFQFAFDYTDRNRSRLNNITDFETFDREFKVSQKDFSELVAYADDKGIEGTKEEIAVSKEKIKTLFKAFVGRNVLDEEGFYPIYHQVDTTFKRAVYELEKGLNILVL
jgi:carboxyl-terminal processing protease